ncbi:MAG: NAD(P)H-binding protein [Fibrobacter sp.]|nr:NAD(P)H-binding protein [Fibrobacter sp.]
MLNQMNQDIKVAVIGGTGKAGRYLVKRLVSQGFRIKALTRNPGKLEETDLVEKVNGDVTDYESVYNLVNGCEVVISTLGQTKGEDPVFSIAAQNIVRAMETLQIKRYIILTGLTLETPFDDKGFQTKMKSLVMKLLFRKIIADKQNEYKILQHSKLDWTIVRVPFVEMTDSQGDVEVSLSDCKGSGMSSADLADFLIGQIKSESYIRKAPFIWNK